MRTEYENIHISESEYSKLVEKFGEAGSNQRIEELSDAIAIHGYKYRSHYRVILVWDRRNQQKLPQPPPETPVPTPDPIFLEVQVKAIYSMFKRDHERGLRPNLPTLDEVRSLVEAGL